MLSSLKWTNDSISIFHPLDHRDWATSGKKTQAKLVKQNPEMMEM